MNTYGLRLRSVDWIQSRDLGLLVGIGFDHQHSVRTPFDQALHFLVLQYCFCLMKMLETFALGFIREERALYHLNPSCSFKIHELTDDKF